jgi:hypothetical protein
MPSVLFRKVATARRIGLHRLLRRRIDRIWLGLLARYFGFNAWHARAPFSCRPYKQTVVDLVNGLTPRVVVEVGSGLGDLLSRIDAVERHAYDVDPGVVRAGRFLHGRRVTFVLGDATTVTQARIDVLVMVNWIHNLSPSNLEQLLLPLVARTRYLVLDAIDTDAPGSYRYKHDFAFLDGVAERLSVTRPPDEPRGFHLFRVIRAGSGTSSPAAEPPDRASAPARVPAADYAIRIAR